MISIVCWLWSVPGRPAQYTAAHVNRLAATVHRFYRAPHRMICVTNRPSGINREVEIVPDREDFAHVPSPHGPNAPSCYRRLRLFAVDAGATFGERIVSLDLDAVAVADLAPLWDRPEPFVVWQDPFRPRQYCGSMWLLTAGALPHVWRDFDPARSPAVARAAGFCGSDQGWISHAVRGAATWTAADGVLSYRADLETGALPLPPSARLVLFHGREKPWSSKAAALPWVGAAAA